MQVLCTQVGGRGVHSSVASSGSVASSVAINGSVASSVASSGSVASIPRPRFDCE